MLLKRINIIAVLLALVAACTTAQEKTKLNEHLKVLEPYIGTWEGEFLNQPEGQNNKDTVSFEVILNGNAVRSVHEVTGGYGGETIYYWNPVTGKIKFWYYTNVGQYAEGTCDVKGNEWFFTATHYGGAVSGWRSYAKVTGADSFETSSKYYQNGEWSEGHGVVYKRMR